METCKAFVFAGKEDFGIIFAEAQLAGAPVIAYGKGGVRDVVTDLETGLFFFHQDVDSICDAVEKFESGQIKLSSACEISRNAMRFSKQEFIKKLSCFVTEKSDGT